MDPKAGQSPLRSYYQGGHYSRAQIGFAGIFRGSEPISLCIKEVESVSALSTLTILITLGLATISFMAGCQLNVWLRPSICKLSVKYGLCVASVARTNGRRNNGEGRVSVAFEMSSILSHIHIRW